MHGAADRQYQRAKPYRQRHRLAFKVTPFPVQPVACAALVQLEAIDIGHVGPVDGVGPADGFIMPKKGERAAGEIGTCIMPAFLALDHHLVPCDPAAPGLVAVGNEPRHAVA